MVAADRNKEETIPSHTQLNPVHMATNQQSKPPIVT